MQSWGGFILGQDGIAQVNAKKDSFPFAAAAQIPKLMAEFEISPNSSRLSPEEWSSPSLTARIFSPTHPGRAEAPFTARIERPSSI